MVERWYLRGETIGACNCEWGCPCSFDAPPTGGYCEGIDICVVREGRYGEVDLGGVIWGSAVRFPGAVHEGNGTIVRIVDVVANPVQRAALETLFAGNGVGLPFDIFAAVTSVQLPTIYAPIAVDLAGIRSTATIGSGALFELGLTRIKNPVTGEEEEIYLDKPTGFTWQRGELGMSTAAKFSIPRLSFNHTGQYAEHAEFAYAGP